MHEAYSFACMRCGHGWEESYDIAHHRDGSGRPYVVYYAHGRRVPSPLTRPSCTLCGGSVVRIMRSGRVESARGGSLFEQAVPMAGPLFVPEPPGHGPVPPSPLSGAMSEQSERRPPRTRGAGAAPPGGEAAGESGRHRNFADLLHVFQRGRH
ncbi:hypothetical protein CRI70_14710 [Streptomyces sp. Ru87]|nr:hypothetical protein CRI70_14710 [Streptomyces sp. Ru87]